MHDTVPRPHPRAGLRRLWQALAILFGLIILGYVILYVTKGRFLKGPFERIASSVAERPVKVGGDFQLYFNPHIKFLAEDLSVANPAWAREDALFTANLVDTELSVLPLLVGDRRFRFVTVEGGHAGLEVDAKGRRTWDFGGGGDFEIPVIDRLRLAGTSLRFIDARRRADVTLRFGALSGTEARVDQPLTFTGGGTALGEPFKIDGALTTPNEARAGGRTAIKFTARAVASRLDVAGDLPSATDIEGEPLRITLQGRNLQDIGRLAGAALPATRAYRLNAVVTKTGDVFAFDRVEGRVGDSDIGGNLKLTRRDGTRPLIEGTLASKVLDIKDVGPLLGYEPARIDRGDVIRVIGGRPRVLPDAPLMIEGLDAFDAKVRYTAATIRTGSAPVSKLEVGFGLDDRILSFEPLAFDLGGGRVTATIAMNARVRPVASDIDIRMTAVPLGRLLTSFDVENSGATASVRGRVQLKARGDSIHEALAASDGRIALVFPSGTLWVRNIELAKLDFQNFVTAFLGKKLKHPSEIRCGLVAFTVRGGKATADPIFIDTRRAIFRGKGGFDFADESLRLSVEGDSKEFSLFSAQSPVGIGGYFAQPSINPISGELIGRGLAAVALGIVATPAAAILAFVDLGEQKDTNCAPVLEAKRAPAVAAADKAAEKRKR